MENMEFGNSGWSKMLSEATQSEATQSEATQSEATQSEATQSDTKQSETKKKIKTFSFFSDKTP
jgi:hypothetical protein